jgi:peroxiredoxin Q/BCP
MKLAEFLSLPGRVLTNGGWVMGIVIAAGLHASAVGLETGGPCPEFSLKGTDGRTYALKDMVGNSPFVIAWYPKAFTGGCTKECISFQEQSDAIREYDVLYFTASVDDFNLNRDFAESLKLDYPILSDPSKKAAMAFGVVDEERPFARRWTFYVGRDGTILKIDKQIAVSNAGVDVLSNLEELGIPKRQKLDNHLNGSEKAAGWQLLFNGHDHSGWMTSRGTQIQAPIEDGALVPYKSGGYLIVHEKQFGDFEFEADVKMSSDQCNSGVFFRVSDLSDPVQTGFEAQVFGKEGNSRHHFGAIYDLAPTSLRAFDHHAWNTIGIRASGPMITTYINGQKVCAINTDDFPLNGKRPDGSQHKFGVIKDMARLGYLGFQDHGHKVWYKNIKVRELDKQE